MLKGKILRISSTNFGFLVTIDNFQKVCKNRHDLNNYLKKLLKKSKDPQKKKLLEQDLKKWFVNSNKNID